MMGPATQGDDGTAPGMDPQAAPGAGIGTIAAMALPLLFFIAALPGFSYWGEPARLLDAAVTLRHGDSPITMLSAALVARLPIGPLSLRIGLSIALWAAVTSGALFAALRLSLQRLGVQREELRVAAAFGSTCVLLGLPPVWSAVMQGNPQVAGIALCALLVHQLLRAQPPSIAGFTPPGADHDPHALAIGGLYLGLLTSHDPGFALCMCPAWLLALRGVRHWPRASLAMAGLGLLPMLLPILRGRDDAPLSPVDPGVQLWRALVGNAAPVLTAGLFVVASLACLSLLRRADHRRFTLIWLSALGVPALLAWLLGASRNAQGAALTLALAAAVAFGTLGLGLLVAGTARTERLGTALSLAWLVLGVVQLRDASMTRGLQRFDTSAVLQRHAAEHLSPRGVVLWQDPRGHADAIGFRTEHGTRPDVLSVPLSRARHPRVAEALVDEAPILRELIGDLLLRGKVDVPHLQSLSGQVPVVIDLSADALPELGETLLPSGALLSVVADGATSRDRQAAAAAQAEYYERVYENVDLHRLDERSRALLLRMHQRDALYYMQAGDRDAARAALLRVEALSPELAMLRTLRAALGDPEAEDPPEGPVDITPFVSPAG